MQYSNSVGDYALFEEHERKYLKSACSARTPTTLTRKKDKKQIQKIRETTIEINKILKKDQVEQRRKVQVSNKIKKLEYASVKRKITRSESEKTSISKLRLVSKISQKSNLLRPLQKSTKGRSTTKCQQREKQSPRQQKSKITKTENDETEIMECKMKINILETKQNQLQQENVLKDKKIGEQNKIINRLIAESKRQRERHSQLQERCQGNHVDKEWHQLKILDLQQQIQQRSQFEHQVLKKLEGMMEKTQEQDFINVQLRKDKEYLTDILMKIKVGNHLKQDNQNLESSLLEIRSHRSSETMTSAKSIQQISQGVKFLDLQSQLGNREQESMKKINHYLRQSSEASAKREEIQMKSTYQPDSPDYQEINPSSEDVSQSGKDLAELESDLLSKIGRENSEQKVQRFDQI